MSDIKLRSALVLVICLEVISVAAVVAWPNKQPVVASPEKQSDLFVRPGKQPAIGPALDLSVRAMSKGGFIGETFAESAIGRSFGSL